MAQKAPIIFFFLFCIFSNTNAQLENKGWWTRDLFTYQYLHEDGDGVNSHDRVFNRVYTQPEIGYALNKHWLAGLVFQYEYINDHYDIPAGLTGSKGSRKKFFGAGPLLRYYKPIGKRLAFMPEFFAFYSEEVRTYITATPFGDFKSPVSNSIVGAGAFPSFVYFMTDRLAVSITFINIQYYSSRGGQSFTVNLNPQQWLLGVECYFNKNRPAATAR